MRVSEDTRGEATEMIAACIEHAIRVCREGWQVREPTYSVVTAGLPSQSLIPVEGTPTCMCHDA